MTSILKAAVFGLGLVAGTAAIAQAQSVATLPPNGGEPVQTQGQTAHTWPYGSTQSFYPKPGGSEVISEPNFQPPTTSAGNPPGQPYSTGPKAN
jgi:hypothetical protein